MTNELQFVCAGLTEGGVFPMKYTGRGENKSPEFAIRNLSPNAKTIAITMDDIKNPLFGTLNHWVIWNMY